MIRLKAVTHASLKESQLPIAVFLFEDAGVASAVPPALRKALLEKAKAEAFRGKPAELARVRAAVDGREREFVLVGLGKRKEFKPEGLRQAAGALCKHAGRRFKALSVLPCGDPQALGEGLLLASYRFEEYKKPDEETLLSEVQVAAESAGQRARLEAALTRAALFSEASCLARDLVNRGPSDKPPQALGKLAQSLAGQGVTVRLIEEDEARKLGMGSYLSVARGSSVPPCFVHLSYKPKGAKRRVALVGKGITFDSGGLSLKPPKGMEEMKMDMAGAASILAVFKVLPRLKPKAEVHGVCAFTYNMPGPDATKPGDVARAMNGKTIEILNTDAEGRLVLADALVYACRLKPEAVVDLATLTGAALVALGGSVTAAMANDRRLAARLLAAAERSGEKMWELPLVEEYNENLKSAVADLRNISKVAGEAGTIIGGLFLQNFVEQGVPWAHLDIAGPVWANGPHAYGPAGGTGAPVRTLLEYLSSLN